MAPDDPPPAARSDARLAALGALALAPFLVLLVRAVGTTWIASADYSLIELQTRRVGTGQTPLVGPYSRFGWNHPGPALFFALAAPFRLFSRYGHGLLAGAALIGAVAVVVIVVVILRAPGSPLVKTYSLLVTFVLLRALGGAFLWDPWNPRVIVLPFLALILLLWWTATGEDRALPAAVAIASFIAQTHVSLVPEVVALFLVALAWLFVTARTAPARDRARRSLVVSGVVFALMWAPPVVQQFQPTGGNLGALWRFWTKSHHGFVGFSHAARLLAPQLSIPAPWMTGHERASVSNGALLPSGDSFPFALVVLLAAGIVAWRRRDRIGLAACSLAATSAFVAWISIARVVGVPFPYILRWDWVVGATCWLASGVVLVPALSEKLRAPVRRGLTYALEAGAAILIVCVTVPAASAVTPLESSSRAAHALTVDIVPQLQKLPRPVHVEADFLSVFVADGVISGLIERGIDTRYPAPLLAVPAQRAVRDESRRGTIIYIASGGVVATYARDPHFHQIASYGSRAVRAAVYVYTASP